MDPDANLAEQRELARGLLSPSGHQYNAQRLAELVLALDEWLSRGNFLPTDWSAHR